MRKLKQEQFDEVAQLRSCDHARRLFQDLPYDILLQCAEFMTVREVLTLSTLSRSLYEFLSPSNLALWAHFTQRVHLEHPRGIKQMLFNDSLLRVYAEVNSVPDPTRVISKQELFQWVMDRCEENILDLRMFADIIYDANSRLALTGLLMALQAVKKRMWYTEVTDVESVRDLLRATVVEEEHDPGWFVLRAIAGRGRTVQRRMPASMFARAHSSNVKAQCRGRQVSVKRLWKKASVVALEYLQLREVLRVVLAVSEVSDHPKAQQRYDSVLSVLCGTTAMLKAEEQLRRCQPCDMDEAGAVIPISAAGNELLRQIRDLNKVTVGGIVSYYFGYVNGRAQRKVFLTALFSMKHLAGAERYEGDSFW
ncbi:hypothetical protein ERJ75_001618900 [Trypanosoma vivax]|nr:hypothetical protein ERJ75_001618900 [Trypanosoma vivax]